MFFKVFYFDLHYFSSLRLTAKTALTLIVLSSLVAPVLGMQPTDQGKGVPLAQRTGFVGTAAPSTDKNEGPKRTRSENDEENDQGARKRQHTTEPQTSAVVTWVLPPEIWNILFTKLITGGSIRTLLNLRCCSKFLLNLNNERDTFYCSEKHLKDIGPQFLSDLLKAFPSITDLTVEGVNVEHGHFMACQHFSRLTKLSLVNNGTTNTNKKKIINKSLHAIASLTRLASLRLQARRSENITNAGWRSLSKLTNLTELALECIPNLNASIRHFSTLPLQKLSCEASGLTNGMPHLSSFTNLTSLNLWGTNIVNGGTSLRSLSGLTKLSYLDLGENKYLTHNWTNPTTPVNWPEGTGLTYLTNLTNLTTFKIGGDTCPSTIAICDIEHLSRLEKLDIVDCEDEDMEDLGFLNIVDGEDEDMEDLGFLPRIAIYAPGGLMDSVKAMAAQQRTLNDPGE